MGIATIVKNTQGKDAERQREIEGLGIRFLRFNDLNVKRNMMGTLSAIAQWIEGHTPDPSQEGELERKLLEKRE